LEKELVEFKIEVEGKFAKSELAAFVFPRISDTSAKSTIDKDDLANYLS
jgi:hypothetical protein